jgi:transcriptional regulator GlxA family with amidase domain
MYDGNSTSGQPGAMPGVPTAALTIEDELAEATLLSLDLHRLRWAVAELSTALKETLRDERSSAAVRLQRAQAMLQAVGGTAPRPSENGPRPALAPWQVRRVLAHVEANLSTRIRNKDLATIAHLSTYHFNVAFRNSVGNSPHEYLIRRRMERARGLMLSTDKTLSEIAIECGLADQPHLTRLFRRFAGESPAAWRRARADPAIT